MCVRIISFTLTFIHDLDQHSSIHTFDMLHKVIKCHYWNLEPDESSIVDLSDVADKPTYVIFTSSRLILAENLNFLFSHFM